MSWLRAGGRIATRGIKTTFDPLGIYTDGGYFDSGEKGGNVLDAVDNASQPAQDAAGKGFATSWDILSGERDNRRAKAAADLAWQRTMDADNTKVQRYADDLEAAGINPIQAASYSGGSPTAQASAPSHTAGSLSGAINSAMGVLGGVTNLKKALAEIPMMQATARKTNADAAYVEASTPTNLRNLDWQGKLHEAHIGQANTGSDVNRATVEQKKVQTRIEEIREKQERYRLPKFAAEASHYNRWGSAAVAADLYKNPWQTGQLVVNSAVDAIAAKAAEDAKKAAQGSRRGRHTPAPFSNIKVLKNKGR